MNTIPDVDGFCLFVLILLIHLRMVLHLRGIEERLASAEERIARLWNRLP